MTEFVEQPLALPGSANEHLLSKTSLPKKYFQTLFGILCVCKVRHTQCAARHTQCSSAYKMQCAPGQFAECKVEGEEQGQ